MELKDSKTKEPNYGNKTFAVASFICGIGGVSVFYFGFAGLVPSILAIVFANIARKREPPNKFAAAGFVLGITGLVFYASLITCGFVFCLFLRNMPAATGGMFY